MIHQLSEESGLPMWVITDHPSDFPDHFVVRKRVVYSSGRVEIDQEYHLAMTLDEARARVPRGLARIPRSWNDDRVIVETWL